MTNHNQEEWGNESKDLHSLVRVLAESRLAAWERATESGLGLGSWTSNWANPESPVPGLCLGSVPVPTVKALLPRGRGWGCSGQEAEGGRTDQQTHYQAHIKGRVILRKQEVS